MEIDGEVASFGEAQPIAWPEDKADSIPQIDYHQVVFHFPWRIERAPPNDIAFVFDVFADFGIRHKVLSAMQYLDFREEILFRLEEPDYLLDLAYIRDHQEEIGKAAAGEKKQGRRTETGGEERRSPGDQPLGHSRSHPRADLVFPHEKRAEGAGTHLKRNARIPGPHSSLASR